VRVVGGGEELRCKLVKARARELQSKQFLEGEANFVFCLGRVEEKTRGGRDEEEGGRGCKLCGLEELPASREVDGAWQADTNPGSWRLFEVIAARWVQQLLM
jgi:hypothetical protein